MPPRKKTTEEPSIVTPTEEEVAEIAPTPERRRFVLYEKMIDKHNTKRIRVELTPCTCDECGLDLAYINKLPPYEELSELEQEKMRGALEAHKRTVHRRETQRVIYEDEIPTSYLGYKHEQRMAKENKMGHRRKG